MGAVLSGFEGLERKLLNLERKVGKGIVRKAVRKAAKPAFDQAKQNARNMVGGKMGGLLAKNLHIRAFKKQRRGQYGIAVKIKPGINEFIHIGKGGTRYYIPAAIEYGHDEVMPIAFLRMAAKVTENKQKTILSTGLAAGIRAVAMS